MDSQAFAQQFLLNEVEKMQKADVKLHLLAAIVHGIETAGALLDPLPFKAKGQGKKRFDLSLRKLFPTEYITANQQINLYGQLRSHMAHCMLPAKSISLESSDMHLAYVDGVLHISLESLHNDYRCAILRLLEKLEAGELKNKRIVFYNLKSI